jgi:hypothetical protein
VDSWIDGFLDWRFAPIHTSRRPIIQFHLFLAGGADYEIKNPRPFPAVGFCRNHIQRQAPTASFLTTTTTRATCRLMANMAQTLPQDRARVKPRLVRIILIFFISTGSQSC